MIDVATANAIFEFPRILVKRIWSKIEIKFKKFLGFYLETILRRSWNRIRTQDAAGANDCMTFSTTLPGAREIRTHEVFLFGGLWNIEVCILATRRLTAEPSLHQHQKNSNNNLNSTSRRTPTATNNCTTPTTEQQLPPQHQCTNTYNSISHPHNNIAYNLHNNSHLNTNKRATIATTTATTKQQLPHNTTTTTTAHITTSPQHNNNITTT